jgi:hypothetical protein
VKFVSQRFNCPNRIFFDLENTTEHDGAVTRIALVTKELCDYTNEFVANPPRLIIEVQPRNSLSRSAANFTGLEQRQTLFGSLR